MSCLMTLLPRACRGAFLCLLVLALSIAAAERTEAGSVTYSWTDDFADLTGFPLFDPSYGTLTQVTITGSMSFTQDFTYQGPINVTDGTFDYSFVLQLNTGSTFNVAGGSGTWDGTDGGGSVSASTTFTVNVNPSDFIGPGGGVFEAEYYWSVTSPSIFVTFESEIYSWTAGGTITYDFVPEPSSLTTGSVAAATALGYWWRRRTNSLRRSRRPNSRR